MNEEKRTPTPAELRELYRRNVNIMAKFRELTGSDENSVEAILFSYDLQSGSYTQALEDAGHRERLDRYTSEIASVLAPLAAGSLLEAGVGEATTLCPVVSKLPQEPAVVAGFDISWSRLSFARKNAAAAGLDRARFFTGDLFHAPIREGSFDVVYTAHTIEPNHGRERAALLELGRITREWLVLFEPSYELGNEATRARIEAHGYCRDLPRIAQELGFEIVEHRLLASPMKTENHTALLLLRKPRGTASPDAAHACPLCREALAEIRAQWFCENCGIVFPVLDGIPCLLPANGIVASKFAE